MVVIVLPQIHHQQAALLQELVRAGHIMLVEAPALEALGLRQIIYILLDVRGLEVAQLVPQQVELIYLHFKLLAVLVVD